MKIVLPKTLAEPLTIPWANINCGMDKEIQDLLDELLNESSPNYDDIDIEELMHKLSERIKEQSDIIGKRRLLEDLGIKK
jgi:hypothetical protein